MSTVHHPAADSDDIAEVQEDLFEGVDFSAQITWETKTSAVATAVPVDITSATVSAKYRQSNITADQEFELTVGDGITLSDPSNGIFTFTITDTQVDALTIGEPGFLDFIFTISGVKSLLPVVFVFTPIRTSSGQ
jgi:hypothetical protein